MFCYIWNCGSSQLISPNNIFKIENKCQTNKAMFFVCNPYSIQCYICTTLLPSSVGNAESTVSWPEKNASRHVQSLQWCNFGLSNISAMLIEPNCIKPLLSYASVTEGVWQTEGINLSDKDEGTGSVVYAITHLSTHFLTCDVFQLHYLPCTLYRDVKGWPEAAMCLFTGQIEAFILLHAV